MKKIIVIPTHRTGTKLLENLLASFQGYDEYPILIVISEYRASDNSLFSPIVKHFSKLPICLETIEANSFELGGLYTAYLKTNYDEFFLLPHSCEIVNHEIFDIVFTKNAGRSVAFGLQTGNWNGSLGNRCRNERLILKYLDRSTHERLLQLGNIRFWQGHVGKYRREVLNKMNVVDYLPRNMIAAISKSELLFTSTYHSLDSSTVVLFPDWGDDGKVIEEKAGKKRLRIENEYIIKWKAHWSPEMVFEDISMGYRAKKYAWNHAATAFRWVKRQVDGIRQIV
jgi:hypothetical protein